MKFSNHNFKCCYFNQGTINVTEKRDSTQLQENDTDVYFDFFSYILLLYLVFNSFIYIKYYISYFNLFICVEYI